MSTQARAFERGESVGFDDVEGFVVLLDAEMKEVVPRQEARFSRQLLPGGGAHQVTSSHTFDIMGKSISYQAVGHEDQLLFVSIVASHPVERSNFMVIGNGG
ncbi:hypothetical protein AB4Y86_00040 [Arthrobacter sp. 2YAF22_2]|uniref:hypothetical protein n=1 Tax=Arthrobacter sp. 2YAF22_2 TaxID=3233029 RepID=UPI003F9312C5